MKVRRVAALSGHNGAVFALTEGEAKHMVISGAGDGWIAQWDLNNPEHGRLMARADAHIYSLCFIKEKQLLLLGDMNGGVHWINVHSPETQKNILHHRTGVFCIRYLKGNVYTAGGDGIFSKWSVEKQRCTDSLQLSTQSLRTFAYSERRNELAIGCSDRNIYIVDASTMTLKSVISDAHQNSVFCLAYAPAHDILASGGRDALLKTWDFAADYRQINSVAAHWYTINAIAFHPLGHLFATGSRDKTIKIWDTQSGELLKVIDAVRDGCHTRSVNVLFWSDFNHWLVSGSDDRSLMVWEIGGED
jgi:WD40 repeat protein